MLGTILNSRDAAAFINTAKGWGSQYNIPGWKIRREPRADYVAYQNKCQFAGELDDFLFTSTNAHFASVLMKFRC